MFDCLDFSSARVLVVGDVMIDQYWYGTSDRISPEAPVPVVHYGNQENRLGGAANVAVSIKNLGAHVTLLGITGDDEQQHILIDLLNLASIEHRLAISHKSPTITKLRIVSSGQQILRIDTEKPFSRSDAQPLLLWFETLLEQHNVVVLSDYAKGSIFPVQKFIEIANKKEVKVLTDPKGKSFKKYQKSYCITPNEKEFIAVVGAIKNEQQFEHKMRVLREKLAIQALLVTRGARGMSLCFGDNPITHIPPQTQTVYDVSGAGDTVLAVLACCADKTSKKNSFDDFLRSAKLANQAASITVKKEGTSGISISELRQLNSHKQPIEKHLERNALFARIKQLKKDNCRIVFSNGCFDLLHIGHIHCLQEASKLGDILVIAVNSDASVKRLKGNDRPINTLQNRIDALKAITCIDWIIEFGDHEDDHDTPLQLISHIQPDYLVKGGDYQIEGIVGYEEIKRYGGQMKLIPFKTQHSTSAIIDKIQKMK